MLRMITITREVVVSASLQMDREGAEVLWAMASMAQSRGRELVGTKGSGFRVGGVEWRKIKELVELICRDFSRSLEDREAASLMVELP